MEQRLPSSGTRGDLPYPAVAATDVFFRSLAEDAGRRAIAVVLSGSGSDGSRGIQHIHDAGGLVLVQQEDTAKFDGMPRAAIATGVVNYILPPGFMPETILEHCAEPPGSVPLPTTPIRLDSVDSDLTEVFQLLRDKFRIDFTLYKPATVMRRIQRRIMISQCYDLGGYLQRLKKDKDDDELALLYRDLLVEVTSFFRDPEAFDHLAQGLLPALSKSIDGRELRVWIPGCATGEEAYSLAILLNEVLSHEASAAGVGNVEFKVFATDVHQQSLDFAAAGIYSSEAVSKVSKERLDRYFKKRGTAYEVSKELRKAVVFARHDVTHDAPFTKIDLISCRNLLIYLNAAAQRQVLAAFHFSLRVGGVLFLGPSEAPGALEAEFKVLDQHWRIYSKTRDVRLPDDARMPLIPNHPEMRRLGSDVSGTSSRSGSQLGLMPAYDVLLDKYAPPSLLINDRRELLHCFGETRRFLHPAAGRGSTDLLDMVDGELRVALGGAIQRACKEQAPVVYKRVRLAKQEDEEFVTLTVEPLTTRNADSKFLLVSLDQTSQAPSEPGPKGDDYEPSNASQQRVETRETELRYTKETLQATMEEFEASNEELQAANEELVSANEELQSTNEELHSVNEELYTVNAEYQRKIDELTELNTDMDNLLRSTEIGTIFLDESFRIRKFTPAVEQAFSLMPQDVGRPISHIVQNVECAGLYEDIERVLESGLGVEREGRSSDGRPLLIGIQPYRLETGAVAGTVMTFVDVTTSSVPQEAVRRIEWLLTKKPDIRARSSKNHRAPYGSLSRLNTYRVLTDAIRESELVDVAGEYLNLLGTAVAINEINGDYALRIIDSSWCRLLDQASRELCETDENTAALASGKWLCHECWAKASQACMKRRKGVDFKCPGGLRVCAMPVRAGKEIVGSVAYAYGDPPRDARKLKKISEAYGVDLSKLTQTASTYNPRPQFINNVARGRLAKYIAYVTDGADRMRALIDDLLSYSRVGRAEVHFDRVNLREVVKTAVANLEMTIQETNASIDVGPLPECLGDGAMFTRLFQNLIGNGIKFHGERRPVVKVSCDGDDGKLCITVRDNGIGIAPEFHERIFGIFQRLHTRQEYPGTGIGLAICKRIVERHGGRIRIESKAGEGSAFHISIPQHEETRKESELQ